MSAHGRDERLWASLAGLHRDDDRVERGRRRGRIRQTSACFAGSRRAPHVQPYAPVFKPGVSLVTCAAPSDVEPTRTARHGIAPGGRVKHSDYGFPIPDEGPMVHSCSQKAVR